MTADFERAWNFRNTVLSCWTGSPKPLCARDRPHEVGRGVGAGCQLEARSVGLARMRDQGDGHGLSLSGSHERQESIVATERQRLNLLGTLVVVAVPASRVGAVWRTLVKSEEMLTNAPPEMGPPPLLRTLTSMVANVAVGMPCPVSPPGSCAKAA